jgi:hypothetical protein
MSKKNVYKTVLQITVLSEGPLQIGSNDDSDPFDLVEINYAITEGSCLGDVEQVSSELVPSEKVEAACLELGNDGAFFNDEDEEEEEDRNNSEGFPPSGSVAVQTPSGMQPVTYTSVVEDATEEVLISEARAALKDEAHWTVVDAADRAENAKILASLILDHFGAKPEGCPEGCEDCETQRKNLDEQGAE